MPDGGWVDVPPEHNHRRQFAHAPTRLKFRRLDRHAIEAHGTDPKALLAAGIADWDARDDMGRITPYDPDTFLALLRGVSLYATFEGWTDDLRNWALAQIQDHAAPSTEDAEQPAREKPPHRPGRRSPYTDDALKGKADAYQAECAAKGAPPTVEGWRQFVGVKKRETAIAYLTRLERAFPSHPLIPLIRR